MLTMSFQTIVILMLIAFIIGMIIGASLAPRRIDIDIDKKLGGDPTTEAPKPKDKKKQKGK